MCAEQSSILTKKFIDVKKNDMAMATITEDDNLLSKYGEHKWKACVRSKADCVFFAGPCAGGSPWNRINRSVGDLTRHQINQKAKLYWKLRDVFVDASRRILQLGVWPCLNYPQGL